VYDDRLGWKAIQIAEDSKRQINEAVRKKELAERRVAMFEAYLQKLAKISRL
jgi:hypothetical protein